MDRTRLLPFLRRCPTLLTPPGSSGSLQPVFEGFFIDPFSVPFSDAKLLPPPFEAAAGIFIFE